MKFLAIASLCLAGLILAEEKEKDNDVGTVIGIDLGTTYSWLVLLDRIMHIKTCMKELLSQISHICLSIASVKFCTFQCWSFQEWTC